MNIIDQMVAQGVPFAREYGGLLDNRSFGGAQVSRTFYARGQTGQQLLLGAYQQMARQVGLGSVKLCNRDRARRRRRRRRALRRHRRARPAHRRVPSHAAHAVVLATGGYGNVFFLSTNAMACNVTAAWRAHREGAAFANPCYTQIHPTCIPQTDDVPVEAHADVGVAAQRRPGVGAARTPTTTAPPDQIPEAERDYYLERLYPSFGNLAPRDIASRAAKRAVDSGRGVGPLKNGVYLDFADAIARLGERRRQGALREPVRDVRADHRREPVRGADAHLPGVALHDGRALGRLRADDHDPRPVLRRRGELLRPRRQPPRRVGADAGPRRRLLRAAEHDQQLPRPAAEQADPGHRPPGVQRGRGARPATASPATCRSAAPARPTTSTASSASIIWDYCGMERTAEGLEKALSEIPALLRRVPEGPAVTGAGDSVNQTLEKAGRVDDFFQLGMLMCRDALERRESCGGHFRAEYQDDEGEAAARRRPLRPRRRVGVDRRPEAADAAHRKSSTYEYVHLAERSYK